MRRERFWGRRLRRVRGVIVVCLGIAAGSDSLPSLASGFDPRVITFGSERDEIKSIPIEKRPYRPLHVYGNSIRRRHGRSVTAPAQSGARR